MHLVFDIGNSNVVIALYKDNAWAHLFRYETKDGQPALYYQNGLSNLLFEWGVHAGDIQQVTISSVVPHLNDKITSAIIHSIGIVPLLLSPAHLKKLSFPVPHVNEIGTDLVANAYGATTKWGQPCIVVDFGTALTFTVAHPVKGIQGVTIAPGIKTAFSSLSSQTAQLPNVGLHLPPSAIGKSTPHAIQAGVLIGYEGLVLHLLSKIKEELPEPYLTVATGGISEAITFITNHFDHVYKNLTIEGILKLGRELSRSSTHDI